MPDRLRVLVIGATGRVGQMVRRAWQAAPPDGLVLQYQARDATRAQAGDLIWDPLAKNAPTGRFDRILSLAGVVPAPGADLSMNIALGLACTRAARALGATRVLLASSQAVYGTALARAYREDDIPAPETPYGIAKLEMERTCAADGVSALRIGNVAGADALLLNVARGQTMRLHRFADGGGPVRSYIGPVDLARVLADLLRAEDLPATLNIAAPAPVTMQALLDAGSTPFDWVAAPAEAVQSITLDCGALTALHPFDKDASSPRAMLAQWQTVKDRA
ncbi:NAD-dependent epimerase/dehydratase family protein [Rhodobacteraceae bacterium KMM 6894]|nr:NAD-dependent epimerase/dehydratase family protein [Rhodobacteraceae bacterium KMM 6894]